MIKKNPRYCSIATVSGIPLYGGHRKLCAEKIVSAFTDSTLNLGVKATLENKTPDFTFAKGCVKSGTMCVNRQGGI